MLRGLLSFRDRYRILNYAWCAFFLNVQNTPPGKRYQRSDRGGMEVTSRASFWVLTLTNLPNRQPRSQIGFILVKHPLKAIVTAGFTI